MGFSCAVASQENKDGKGIRMNNATTDGSLELDVKDFGPIARAQVNLRPLTVFVGPSNTGKSYLAILIYALHRFFAGETGFGFRRMRSRVGLFFNHDQWDLSDDVVDLLLETGQEFTKRSSETTKNVVLTKEVANELRRRLDGNALPLANEIGRCFGVGEAGALTRRGRASSAHVKIRQQSPSGFGGTEHALTLGRNSELLTTVPSEVAIPVNRDASERIKGYIARQMSVLDETEKGTLDRKPLAMEILSFIGDLVMPSTIGTLHLPAYYLPADRTGVMHAHSVVVSALIANAPRAGLRPTTHTPILSGVLADFLEQLIEIDHPRWPRHKRRDDLGTRIERDILGGSVRIDRSAPTNYPRFAYQPEGWKDDLALANASSMISELAPVVLYLRHLVMPRNVLIIEEPESHLHPAMQVEFTRHLAALINAGIRVIVTTHSEWLLEELANIVGRSVAPESKGSGSSNGKVALRPDQVGAWLFENKLRPKGSVVREIRLDETGLYPAGYDSVAMALHNEWAELSSRAENGS